MFSGVFNYYLSFYKRSSITYFVLTKKHTNIYYFTNEGGILNSRNVLLFHNFKNHSTETT
jgi:hypothetical protein